jgi:outer membrane protein assembly factor BamE (lipoprotein component of BamABCDE complex)
MKGRKIALVTLIAALLVCFLIAGCASYQSQASRIEQGMSKQQVTSIMGEPHDRTIKGNTETWYYWKAYSHAWIYFTDGRVSGMETDNN